MKMEKRIFWSLIATGAMAAAAGGLLVLGTQWGPAAAQLPLTFALTAGLVVGCAWLAARLARGILEPITALAERPDAPFLPEGCPELEPLVACLRQQQGMILQQMAELEDDRGTIKAITDNMQEGLVIVSTQKAILSINSSAISLLGARLGEYTGRSISSLSRLPELEAAVDTALEGRGSSPVVKCGPGACQFFVNPVYLEEKLTGALVLVLDVTQREKAEKVRQDFSANVSHELRTPLTSISGFAEMIENGMAVGSDAELFAGKITREAARLQHLIDDIIRLSRLDEHAQAPMVRTDLTAICREVLASLTLVAQKRQVTLSLTGEPAFVPGDPGMLAELLTNLCDNSIKYNNPGGSVAVETSLRGHNVLVTVRDTGIGIPRDSFSRIFERFYRVDKSRSKQTGGTGLGLSISKHIVECHGGQIALESELGRGTVITVTLPGAE